MHRGARGGPVTLFRSGTDFRAAQGTADIPGASRSTPRERTTQLSVFELSSEQQTFPAALASGTAEALTPLSVAVAAAPFVWLRDLGARS
jgi:hypothetical protein